jgi:hypothetical protein
MSESGLTDWEYVSLVGHYHGLNEQKQELKDRGYSDAVLKHLRKQKTTLVESLNVKFTSDGIVYPYFNYVITLYFAYKNNGILPFDGCLADQPAKIIEIFNTLDALTAETQQKAAKEQERLSRQNGRNRR